MFWRYLGVWKGHPLFRICGTLLLAGAGTWNSTAQGELLVFTANWCKVCRLMDSTTERMLNEGFAVRMVDVDQHPDSCRQYRIRGVPTLVFVDGNRELHRSEGPLSYAQLRDWFAQAGPLPAEPPLRPSTARATTQRESTPPLLQPPIGPATLVANPSGSTPSAIQKALVASVRLKVVDDAGHSFGSGTVIDVHGQHGLVVTCAHIFRESKGQGAISVDTFAGGATHTVPGQLVRYDLDQDIALVSIPLPGPIEPIQVSSHVEEIQKQQPVFSIGCDRGADPTVQQSQIVDINRYLHAENILIQGHPVDGRSGGGLFDTRGQLIGVCNAADHERNEGLFASLPVIHRILDRSRLSSVYQRAPPGRTDAANSAGGRSSDPVRPNAGFEFTAGPPAASRASLLESPLNAAAPSSSSDTEMICIVRSRSDQHAPAEVIVVPQPSDRVLSALRAERR